MKSGLVTDDDVGGADVVVAGDFVNGIRSGISGVSGMFVFKPAPGWVFVFLTGIVVAGDAAVDSDVGAVVTGSGGCGGVFARENGVSGRANGVSDF